MPVPPVATAVSVDSCVYWRVPGYSSGRGTSLRTLGVRIAYHNVSSEPVTAVTFLVKTDIHTEYVTDRGVFSPNIRIVHQFYTTYAPYYDAKTHPDACRVVRVRLANGTLQEAQK